MISVPGPYAAGEARQALADGSARVPVLGQRARSTTRSSSKQRARDQRPAGDGPGLRHRHPERRRSGLRQRRAARRDRSGRRLGHGHAGSHQLCCAQAGEGISHAIGTGGRDLHERVGGITTLQALELLRDDPATAHDRADQQAARAGGRRARARGGRADRQTRRRLPARRHARTTATVSRSRATCTRPRAWPRRTPHWSSSAREDLPRVRRDARTRPGARPVLRRDAVRGGRSWPSATATDTSSSTSATIGTPAVGRTR